MSDQVRLGYPCFSKWKLITFIYGFFSKETYNLHGLKTMKKLTTKTVFKLENLVHLPHNWSDLHLSVPFLIMAWPSLNVGSHKFTNV